MRCAQLSLCRVDCSRLEAQARVQHYTAVLNIWDMAKGTSDKMQHVCYSLWLGTCRPQVLQPDKGLCEAVLCQMENCYCC